MSVIISMDFLTRFLRMTRRILFCWRDSLEMLRGRSSESTTPCYTSKKEEDAVLDKKEGGCSERKRKKSGLLNGDTNCKE